MSNHHNKNRKIFSLQFNNVIEIRKHCITIFCSQHEISLHITCMKQQYVLKKHC